MLGLGNRNETKSYRASRETEKDTHTHCFMAHACGDDFTKDYQKTRYDITSFLNRRKLKMTILDVK